MRAFRLRSLVLLFGFCTALAACAPDPEPPDREDPAAAADADLRSAPLHAAAREVVAPDFTLPALSGEPFRLHDHLGQVIVLNLWATWCGPCRFEIPDFIELQAELGDRGLLIVGVSLDEEGAAVVRPFAAEMAVNYPVVVDDGQVDAAYGPTTVLPTTFVIDRRGMVRRYAPGMLTKASLRPVLLELLDEKPA